LSWRDLRRHLSAGIACWTKLEITPPSISNHSRYGTNRLARALIAVTGWCRKNRHRPILDQRAALSAKLTGHYAYYGITGNIEQLDRYFQQVMKVWKKWLERRTRAKPFPWDRFTAFLARHPLPRPKIIHCYATVSETLP
jgi:RNA-directed DNA polymerase